MKKILAVGDAGCHTGFARVLKGVMDYLYNTGQYDIAVRGINYMPNHGIYYPYETLPVSATKLQLQVDPLGIDSLKQHIDDVQPDVLWLLQDIWNVSHYLLKKPRELPTVVYFPVDCPNIKWGYTFCLGAVAEACCYTHFGARESAAAVRDGLDILQALTTKNGIDRKSKSTWMQVPAGPKKETLSLRLDRLGRWQNPESWNVIPHGIDHNQFGIRDKAECRRNFGVKEDAFVVGCVGTNQFRKRLDLTIRAFAYLCERVPNAVLMLHCMGGSKNRGRGWDLEQLGIYYGVADRMFVVDNIVPVLTEDGMVDLYNCFDVHINTSGGEGWSLCSSESAACGVPQLVPDWSGTREIWRNHGVLLPILDYRIEPNQINTCHALVDVRQAGDQLVVLARDEKARAYWAELALQNVKRHHSWERVGQGFGALIERACTEPDSVPTSFDDLDAQRIGECKSELAGRAVFGLA